MIILMICGALYAGNVNHGLGKPIFSSSSYASVYDDVYANDGNFDSLWGSSVSPGNQWIYIDLEKEGAIKAVTLDWYGSYYATRYQAAVSNDAVNWQFVHTESEGQGGEEIVTMDLKARYVGFLFTGRNNVAYGLREIGVYSEYDVTPVLVKEFGGNGEDELKIIRYSPDGTYIVGGISGSSDIPGCTPLGNNDVYITKLDKNLNTVWQILVGTEHNDSLHDLTLTQNSGYLVALSFKRKSNGSTGNRIIRLDNQGNILWDNYYSEYDQAFTAKELEDGRILVGCSNFDAFLVDEHGTKLSDFDFNYSTFTDLAYTPDGRLFFLGIESPPLVPNEKINFGMLQSDLTYAWGSRIMGDMGGGPTGYTMDKNYVQNENYCLDG